MHPQTAGSQHPTLERLVFLWLGLQNLTCLVREVVPQSGATPALDSPLHKEHSVVQVAEKAPLL